VSDDPSTTVRKLLIEGQGVPEGTVTPDARILHDLGVDGGDAAELFEALHERFGTDFKDSPVASVLQQRGCKLAGDTAGHSSYYRLWWRSGHTVCRAALAGDCGMRVGVSADCRWRLVVLSVVRSGIAASHGRWPRGDCASGALAI
jgi:acyl carrier protein